MVSLPGRATKASTALFHHQQGHHYLTTKIGKTGWTVNCLAHGLPRSLPSFSPALLSSTLASAVLQSRQNLIEVYHPQYPPKVMHQPLLDLLQRQDTKKRGRGVTRESLVLWGTLNDGRTLSPVALKRELDHALASTGLETLDLAVVKVDMSQQKAVGSALLEELVKVFEFMDKQIKEGGVIQAFGVQLDIPWYQEAKGPSSTTSAKASSSSPDLTDHHQVLLPDVVEEAASVVGSGLVMMMYPLQLTHKNIITLPFLDPDQQMLNQFSVKMPDRPEEEGDSSEWIDMTRMAMGSLWASSPTPGVPTLPLITSMLHPTLARNLCEALDGMAPPLQSTPLLEHKVLRAILSAGCQLVQLQADDHRALATSFLRVGGLSPKDILPYEDCEKIYHRFYLPARTTSSSSPRPLPSQQRRGPSSRGGRGP